MTVPPVGGFHEVSGHGRTDSPSAQGREAGDSPFAALLRAVTERDEHGPKHPTVLAILGVLAAVPLPAALHQVTDALPEPAASTPATGRQKADVRGLLAAAQAPRPQASGAAAGHAPFVEVASVRVKDGPVADSPMASFAPVKKEAPLPHAPGLPPSRPLAPAHLTADRLRSTTIAASPARQSGRVPPAVRALRPQGATPGDTAAVPEVAQRDLQVAGIAAPEVAQRDPQVAGAAAPEVAQRDPQVAGAAVQPPARLEGQLSKPVRLHQSDVPITTATARSVPGGSVRLDHAAAAEVAPQLTAIVAQHLPSLPVGGRLTLRIAVHPPMLGPVSVTIVRSAQGISLVIVAATQEAGGALSSGADELKRRIGSLEGDTPVDVTVAVNDDTAAAGTDPKEG